MDGKARDPRAWRTAWRAWRRVSRPERRDFALSCALVALVGISLRTMGVRRTLEWTGRVRPTPRATGDDQARIAAAIAAVRRAERYGPFSGTCLSRSLTLRYLAARAGVATDLRFGGQRRNGRFEGHAWVERNGVPLNDTPDVASRVAPFRPSGAASVHASPPPTLPRSS